MPTAAAFTPSNVPYFDVRKGEGWLHLLCLAAVLKSNVAGIVLLIDGMPLEALQPNCYRWQLCHKVAESMGGVLH